MTAFVPVKDLDSLPKFYLRGQIAPSGGLFSAIAGETVSALDVINFLQLHKDDPEIVVEISSNGGYKAEGIEIHNLLKNSGKTVNAIIQKASSIATVVVLGCNGQRLISEHAPFLVHFARIDPQDLGLESLTAEDLQRLAEDTERADKQIVDLYCAELGEEKRMELVAAMADERDLGAKGAIKLGFATGFYKKKKKEKMTAEDFSSCLITDTLADIIQNNNMQAAQESKFEKLLKNFSRLISKIKNEVTLKLADGVTQIYVVPADPANPGDLMNGTAYTVDEAGMPTETFLADGEHVLEDGKTIVVAGGKVTEVRDAQDAAKELADAKAATEAKIAELAAVTAQVAEKDAKIAALEAEKTQLAANVDVIKNEFEALKKEVPGDATGRTSTSDPAAADLTKMSVAQRFIYLRKEQIKAEKASSKIQ